MYTPMYIICLNYNVHTNVYYMFELQCTRFMYIICLNYNVHANVYYMFELQCTHQCILYV